jgi:hypothetical protein
VAANPGPIVVALTAWALVACSNPQPAAGPTAIPLSPSPSPSPSPGAGPHAVMVQRAGGGEPYVIQLIRLDGHALPAVHAVSRALKNYFPPASPCPSAGCSVGAGTANYQMPETSTTSSRVYFLDGEADVKSLSVSGQVSLVRHLEVPASSNAAFAVSPDNRRIAVAILTYGPAGTTPAFSLRLYVEDLRGGNRSELFASNSIAEWPVGWHAGKLIVAIGQPGVFTGFNPYGAVEYHLVDPATGVRVAALTCSYGPLVAAGTACWKPGEVGRQDWSGTITPFHSNPAGLIRLVQESNIALSPDGSQVAAALQATSGNGNRTQLFREGSEAALATDAAPLGWLDGNHVLLLTRSGPAIAALPGGAITPAIGLTHLPGQGWPSFLGVLPAALD